MKCPICGKRIKDENKEVYTNAVHLNYDESVHYDKYTNSLLIVYCSVQCMISMINEHITDYRLISKNMKPYIKIKSMGINDYNCIICIQIYASNKPSFKKILI